MFQEQRYDVVTLIYESEEGRERKLCTRKLIEI